MTFNEDKSTGVPSLVIRFSASFSMIVRMSGNSSTTSLKSSACRTNTSHTVCATTHAVRLALVKRHISVERKYGNMESPSTGSLNILSRALYRRKPKYIIPRALPQGAQAVLFRALYHRKPKQYYPARYYVINVLSYLRELL